MAAFQTSNPRGHPCSLVQTTEPRAQLFSIFSIGEMFNISMFGRTDFDRDGQLCTAINSQGQQQKCNKCHEISCYKSGLLPK